MCGHLDLLIELLPQVPASAHAEALGELVQHASVVGRNDVEPPLSHEQITFQTGVMRRIASVLIAADAGMPPIGQYADHRVAEMADAMVVIADILPIAGVVGWVWCNRHAAACADSPAVTACANGPPLGIDDPATAAWASRRAAEHADEAWSMRLLAAIGAAA